MSGTLWYNNPITAVQGAKMASIDANGNKGYVSPAVIQGSSYNWGLGLTYALGTVSVVYGTTAGTAAQGNDARIVGALQAAAIPAAPAQLLGGSGTAGAAAAITVGSGLSLASGTLTATGGSGGGTSMITLTAAQIASPDAPTLANLDVTYRLNVAPYTRYRSNGVLLVPVISGGVVNLTQPANETETIPFTTNVVLTGDSAQDVLGTSSRLWIAANGHTDTSQHCAGYYGEGTGFDSVAGGTANVVNAFVAVSGNQGLGTVNNAIDFRSRSDINVGGGTVVNHYGFYQEQSSAATHEYGAYFSAPVGLGTQAPTYNLQIGGAAGNFTGNWLSVGAGFTGSLTVTNNGMSLYPGYNPGAGGFGCTDLVVGYNGQPNPNNSTQYFFYLNSCAGKPTGVPAQASVGRVPIIADSTVPGLTWMYVGGSWAASVGGGASYSAGTGLTLSGATFSLGTVPLSNLGQGGAALGQVPAWNGTQWVPSTVTSGGSSYVLPSASTTVLGGVKPDGVTVTTASDGTLTVAGVAISTLADISTLGGPALSDLDVVSRGGTDYKSTRAEGATLFRKTPAGSRTVTLASGSTVATLTATDNDKTVVVTGVAGSLAVDGTITDGFRCQVINHTGSALTLTGITGLGGSTLGNGAAALVTLANAATEATLIGAGGGYTLPAATTTTLGGVMVDGTTISATGGVISAIAIATNALSALPTLPLGTDVFVVNRAGVDYQTTVSALRPATVSVGVSGVVAQLPGGAGAAVYRQVMVRGCSFAANLATPYPPQGQAGTLPTASAAFGISKRSGGTTSSLGTITISTAGAISASTSAASFAAGDELIITAPSPIDATLADVAFALTGSWS